MYVETCEVIAICLRVALRYSSYRIYSGDMDSAFELASS